MNDQNAALEPASRQIDKKASSDVIDERNVNAIRKPREFFYVDVERVRSYVSQLNRGIIDSIISKETTSKRGEAAAKFLGAGASTYKNVDTSREETRSLQELTAVIFEELYERDGILCDLSPSLSRPGTWQSGSAHDELYAGQLLRFTGHLRVLDSSFSAGRINKFNELIHAWAGTMLGEVAPEPPVPPSRQGGRTRPGRRVEDPVSAREQAKREFAQATMQGMPPEQMEDIGKFISAFMHDSISMRAFPCGEDFPNFNFSGTLLSRNEYIQEERGELYSRYGTRMNDWTVIMQIARIPNASINVEMPDFGTDIVVNGRVDRVATERIIDNFFEYIERMGFSEGPVFPAVSVTPLVIYREFY